MKTFSIILFFVWALVSMLFADAGASARASNTIILDELGVKNLGIEVVPVEESDFEETIFALGRIEPLPGHRAIVSSRISGRVLEVFIKHDHQVTKGDPALVIESRQPGEPPPKITVTAPLSGLVSATYIVPGEPVNPDKALAEIIDVSEVYAIARVPEHLAGLLKRGQKAHITVGAASDRIFDANLEHLGVQTDVQSGTVEAAFRVKNPDLILRPGMRAEFSIVIAQRKNVLSIPRSAVQGDPANRFVYVKDFDLPNAFIRTPVELGARNERFIEIKSGLFPGDEVVTNGSYSLAFAGKGSVSLKEALDAAHGHEHNEDGSEITPKQKAAKISNSKDGTHSSDSVFWKIISGVLFVLLLISLIYKKRPISSSEKKANPITSNRKPS